MAENSPPGVIDTTRVKKKNPRAKKSAQARECCPGEKCQTTQLTPLEWMKLCLSGVELNLAIAPYRVLC